MALNWNWKDKVGTLITTDADGIEYSHNIYSGNALMIIVDEWVDSKTGENMYGLYNFICDETHLKNCLGLTKGYDNVVKGWNWKELHLDVNYKSTPKIAAAFAKAKQPIAIKLYSKED